jgi:hypothetical protein
MKKTYTNSFIDLKYKINDLLKLKKTNYCIDYNYYSYEWKRKIELILYHMNKNWFYENTIQNRQLNIFLWKWNPKEIYKILYWLYCYLSKSKDIKYLSFYR